MQDSDRRSAYRQPGDRCTGLALGLRRTDGQPFSGNVVDASAGGVGARSDAATALAPGQQVEVEVRDANGERTRLQAEVLAPEQHGHDWRYGLRFMAPPAPGPVDARSFYETFNRRGAYRVPLDEGDEIRVTLTAIGDEPEPLGTAQLRNLSTSGAGLLASSAVDLRLGGRSGLLASISLPGLAEPVVLVASVRNRARHAGGIYLGLEFDPRASEHFLDSAEDILEFVLQRLQPPAPI